jgi:hypothetical protein
MASAAVCARRWPCASRCSGLGATAGAALAVSTRRHAGGLRRVLVGLYRQCAARSLITSQRPPRRSRDSRRYCAASPATELVARSSGQAGNCQRLQHKKEGRPQECVLLLNSGGRIRTCDLRVMSSETGIRVRTYALVAGNSARGLSAHEGFARVSSWLLASLLARLLAWGRLRSTRPNYRRAAGNSNSPSQ